MYVLGPLNCTVPAALLRSTRRTTDDAAKGGHASVANGQGVAAYQTDGAGKGQVVALAMLLM